MKKPLATMLVALVAYPALSLAQEQAPYPAAPTPEHAVLQTELGVWNADITMSSPTGETIKTHGQETVTKLGELWTTSTFEYDYMGQPTTGHGVFGFDPQRKQYVGTWFEAGNPFASRMVGNFDKNSKTMTWLMKSKDSTGQESDMRIIVNYPDANTRDFQMQAKMGDDYTTIMTIQFAKQ